MKTSPFGRVQNRHLVREVRVLAFGNRRTVLSRTSSLHPSARMHGRAPDRFKLGASRRSRIRLLASDEPDNVPFCRTVTLDISLGHRKRGMSSHLLDIAKRSTCFCDLFRDSSDKRSPARVRGRSLKRDFSISGVKPYRYSIRAIARCSLGIDYGTIRPDPLAAGCLQRRQSIGELAMKWDCPSASPAL